MVSLFLLEAGMGQADTRPKPVVRYVGRELATLNKYYLGSTWHDLFIQSVGRMSLHFIFSLNPSRI